MTKPTPRTKPIDLSKCKVGQPLLTRNGRIVHLKGPCDSRNYPFLIDAHDGKGGWSCRKDGSLLAEDTSGYDIVALLPLPKKAGKPGKKAPKRMQKALAAFDTIDAPTVRRCIKLLEGLLKP